MFWLSQQAAPSVPMPTLSFLLQHGLDRGDAVAEQHVAAGVVRHGGAVVGEAGDVVVVEPHAMGGDEIGAEQAEILQMRGRRLAVFLEADDHLDLGLVHVRVQPDAELAREAGAAAHELVAAVVRDRRGDGGADKLAVEAPVRQHAAHGRRGSLRRVPCAAARPPSAGPRGARREGRGSPRRRRCWRPSARPPRACRRRRRLWRRRRGPRASAGETRRSGRSRRCSPSSASRARRCRWRDTCPRPCGCR